jgi:prevent-host-death family protein
MTTTVNVHEAKTHLSRLLAQVEAGEEVVIARDGNPIAILTAFKKAGQKRQLGLMRGRFNLPDDFFDPLSEEELRDWWGL